MSDIVPRGNIMLANIAAAQGAILVPLAERFHGHAYGPDLGEPPLSGTFRPPAFFSAGPSPPSTSIR
jgi:hypothetical protein